MNEVTMACVPKHSVKTISNSIDVLNGSTLDLLGLSIELSVADCVFISEKLKTSNVTFLSLDTNKIQSDGLKFVWSALKYTKIKKFLIHSSVTANSFTEMSVLSESLKCSQVVDLHISNHSIDEKDMMMLVSGLKSSKITKLDLSASKINYYGIEALANCLKNTEIDELNLSLCHLDDLSTEYLFGKLRKSKVQKLNLLKNEVGSGFEILADVLKDSAITHLDLSYCKLDSTEFQCLAEGLKYSKVTCLRIENNYAGPDGCESIGNILNETKITELDFSSNIISGEGLTSLLDNFSNSGIVKLSLSNNLLENKAVISLANAIKHSKLEWLNLKNNRFTGIGVLALLNSISSSRLTDLNVSGNWIEVVDAKLIAAAVKNITSLLNLDISDCFTVTSSKSFSREFQHDINIPKESKVTFKFDNIFNNNNIFSKKKSIEALKYFDVKHLTFTGNVTNDDINFIRKACNQINELKLSKMKIDPEQLTRIIDAIKYSNVQKLEFIHCELNNQHAKIISRNLKHLNISSLNLQGNEFSIEGVMAVLKELERSRLIHLSLPNVKHSTVEHDIILSILKNSKLITFRFGTKRFTLNELNSRKARDLIEYFNTNLEVDFNRELVEYFYYFEYFKEEDKLWYDIDAKNRKRIKRTIELRTKEFLFYFMDLIGNHQKTYFDKLPREVLYVIASYLKISDINFKLSNQNEIHF